MASASVLAPVQEPAQEAGKEEEEEVLSEFDDEAGQLNLQDSYSTILQQAGLHGDALDKFLTAWMEFISSEVSQLSNRLGRQLARIPGSHAAQLIVEQQLATAVNMVAGELSCMLTDSRSIICYKSNKLSYKSACNTCFLSYVLPTCCCLVQNAPSLLLIHVLGCKPHLSLSCTTRLGRD